MENTATLIKEKPLSLEFSEVGRWAIPIALLLCVILAFFDKVSIAALFSDMEFLKTAGLWNEATNKPFDDAKIRLGLLMTSFLLTYGFSSIFLSFIGDLISPVKLLMGMMISWGIIMLFMGFANSFAELFWWRMALGVAEGPLFAVAYTIVKKTFPPKEQARATMMWIMGTPIGAFIGFPVTIFILNNYGWRMTFFVMAAITLVVLVIAYVILSRINFTMDDSDKFLNSPPKLSFQDHVKASQVLIAQPLFWLVCLFNIALLSYLWGMNSWLPSYLKETRGLDTKTLGIAASLPFLAMLIGEIFGAFVSDRLGRRAMMCAIAVLGAGAGLLLVVQVSGVTLIILAMSFSMFCWGLAPPSIFPLLSRVVDPKVSATAGGVLNGVGNLVSAMVPLMVGALAVHFESMTVGIVMLAIIAIIGGVALVPHIVKKL